MIEMFNRANEHQGAAFVEIYQNCNVFNDGAFDTILNKDARPNMLIDLKHGEPIRFGAEQEFGVTMNEFGEAEIVRVDDVGEDHLVVHDERRPDPSLAFALSRLADHPTTPTPVGVFRAVDRPTYEGEMQRQLVDASAKQRPGRPRRPAALRAHLVRRLEPAFSPASGRPSRCAALGLKNVVFCGMRARSVAAARVSATVTGEAQDRGARVALVDRRPRPRPRRGGTARRRRAGAGTTSASTSAASVAATAGCSSMRAPSPARSGCGTARARPCRSTRPSPPVVAIAFGQLVDGFRRDRSRVAR